MAEAVDDLRALERRDAELAASAQRLRELDAAVAAVRGRAEEIDAFFAAYPETENRLREAMLGAETELAERRLELEEAKAAVVDATNEDVREAAERLVRRVSDHVSVAEGRRARTADALEELEQQAAALPDELPQLAARAENVTHELPGITTPEGAPRALIEWAGHTHASLFVATGQIDLQRERVIREANELATMLLGEPTYGSTPAQALARVTSDERRRQGR